MEQTEPTATTVAEGMVTQPSSIIMKRYEAKYKKFFDRQDKTEENMTKLYSLIWGQCTEALQVTLEGIDDFQAKDDAFDEKWLLETLSDYLWNRTCRWTYANQHTGQGDSFQLQTEGGWVMWEFHDTLNNFVMNLDLAKINVVKHMIIMDTYIQKLLMLEPTLTVMECEAKLKHAAVESSKAVTFLPSADMKWFGHLIAELKLDMLKGHDNYPTMVRKVT